MEGGGHHVFGDARTLWIAFHSRYSSFLASLATNAHGKKWCGSCPSSAGRRHAFVSFPRPPRRHLPHRRKRCPTRGSHSSLAMTNLLSSRILANAATRADGRATALTTRTGNLLRRNALLRRRLVAMPSANGHHVTPHGRRVRMGL
jgi:hypothetical protein